MSVPSQFVHRLRLLRAHALRRTADFTAPALERLGTRLFMSLERPADLLTKARTLSGLEDFHSPRVEEALTVLLDSLTTHNKLSSIGRAGTRNDLLRLLTNNLLLTQMSRSSPDLQKLSIQAPVFIMGLPRTASTFLHSLLILDDRHCAPTIAEVTYPHFALPSAASSQIRMRRALQWLDVLEPDFQSAYPSQPDSPQECSEILSNTLESLRFDSTFDVPEYLEWMDGHHHVAAYRFHKLFLQSLMSNRSHSRRWVLKCPDHVFYYRDLLEVYPDARIIVTHRDPGRVLPSVASLTMILQGLFSDRLDPERVCMRVLDRWVTGARKVIEITRFAETSAHRVLHVFYDELVESTLPTLDRIYRFLETPMSSDVERKIAHYTHQQAVGSYRPNRYTRLCRELLPMDLVHERFRDYIDYFGLETRDDPQLFPKEARGALR